MSGNDKNCKYAQMICMKFATWKQLRIEKC